MTITEFEALTGQELTAEQQLNYNVIEPKIENLIKQEAINRGLTIAGLIESGKLLPDTFDIVEAKIINRVLNSPTTLTSGSEIAPPYQNYAGDPFYILPSELSQLGLAKQSVKIFSKEEDGGA